MSRITCHRFTSVRSENIRCSPVRAARVAGREARRSLFAARMGRRHDQRENPAMLRLLIAVTAAAALTACGATETTSCGDGASSTMCPGHDCLACHAFKAAGTVYAADGTTPVSGATVTILDKNGVTKSLTTNSAGNFYTSNTLAFPLQRVTLGKGGDSALMTDVVGGGCNGCHDGGFRIHLP